MAEETQFKVGAEASCSDAPCGEVRRFVIDPATETLTHLVIEPRHGDDPGRLVPMDLIDTTTGAIRLRCTIAEFNNLDPAEERELAETAGIGSSMPGGPPAGIPEPAQIIIQDVVPAGAIEMTPGDLVHALDGAIGRVQGFLVDSGDHRMTHVLLRKGHLWGRKEVSIPVSAVTGVEDGIRLNMTKKQVGDLPPVGRGG